MFARRQERSSKKVSEYYLTDTAKDIFKEAFNKVQKNLAELSGADDLLCGK